MEASFGAVERYTVFWLTSYLYLSWLHIYAMKSFFHCDLDLQHESSLCFRLSVRTIPLSRTKPLSMTEKTKTLTQEYEDKMRVSNKGLDKVQPRLASSSISESVVISSFAAKASRQSTM